MRLGSLARLAGFVWFDRSILTCFFIILLAVAALRPAPLLGAEGDLVPSFDAGAGATKLPIILGQVAGGSGTTLVFGYFSAINGTARTSIARLNSDGSLDSGFNSTLSGEVRTAAVLASGKILIGGRFTIGVGGGAYYNFARLNSDGSLDTSLYQTLDWYGAVNSIGVQSDNRIMLGGYSLTIYGQSTAYHLVRFESDGSWDNFYPSLTGTGGVVDRIQILNDDVSNPDRARIFGTLPDGAGLDYVRTHLNDGTLQHAYGDETTNGPIHALAVQTDDKVLLAGNFTEVLGATRNRLARLNSNGTLDTGFTGGTGANGPIKAMILQGDGKIVLAGGFTSFNNTACGNLVRLTTAGAVDGTFSVGVGADDQVFAMETSGTNIVLCGAFRKIGNSTRQGIALLSSGGSLQSSFNTLTSTSTGKGIVYAFSYTSDRKILMAGDFTGVGGKYHGNIALLNRDGSVDSTFNAATDGFIRSLAVQADGKILAAGTFGAANGSGCSSLVRFSSTGELDPTFLAAVTKLDGSVSELRRVLVLNNNQIFIGGHFRLIDDTSRTIVARLNTDGSLDASFDAQVSITSGASIKAYDMAETGTGKYVVAGYVVFEGLTRGWLGRLTSAGLLDTTFGPSGGFTPSDNVQITAGAIKDMDLQDDGSIIVVGDFSEIKDGSWSPPQRGKIARFTPDGLLDGTFTTDGGANNNIECLALQPDGKMLVGGYFTRFNLLDMGQPDNRIRLARVLTDGSLDETFLVGTGANDAIFSCMLLPGAVNAMIGGQFTTYQDSSRPGVAMVSTGQAALLPMWIYQLLLL